MVATLVELSSADGVGAAGVPVKVGEASGALAARSVVRHEMEKKLDALYVEEVTLKARLVEIDARLVEIGG